MNKFYKYILLLSMLTASTHSFSQSAQATPKVQMRYIGTFEAGQPGAGIYKLYDASDDVVCYILMPDTASRKQVDGKWVYEGNALGSLSCLKANSSASSLIKNK